MRRSMHDRPHNPKVASEWGSWLPSTLVGGSGSTTLPCSRCCLVDPSEARQAVLRGSQKGLID
jgi:hypothetical protein